ncbi:hypothetical protein A2U01_0050771, partial [Trifolium medium]|nr:hypothetical protein [Trifolium medium]
LSNIPGIATACCLGGGLGSSSQNFQHWSKIS